MRVAIFHNQPVPPKHYGGTERVAAWLCKGLLEWGHQVTLFAPDSGGDFSQRVLAGVTILSWSSRQNALESFSRALARQKVDVVHSMVPFPVEFERKLGLPVVTTIHGNGKPGESFSDRAVFVSADHSKRHGRATYVWNGLDPDEFHHSSSFRRGFGFLGKTSWSVKNLKGAASVCAAAGVSLRIAGGARPWNIRAQAFFKRGWEWLGPVSGERKALHLARVRALLFPVLWPEPFGLVVAEALFSGTPVIATPMGSLPELVPSSVGVLIPWADQEAWVETLQQVDQGSRFWDEEVCRSYANKNFHYRSMTERYLELYRRAESGEKFE
jgi:glycosyltransferase involved in cell wall biosynthesis